MTAVLPPLPARSPLLSAALRALAMHGPTDQERLAHLLGLDPYADVEFDALVDDLLAGDRVVELADGLLADAVALLGGAVLTHRLSADEAAGGFARVLPDLLPLIKLADDSFPLAGGGRAVIQIGITDDGDLSVALSGPEGWLRPAAAGDLVGFALRDGVLEVTAPVVATAAAEAIVGVLREAAGCCFATADRDDAVVGVSELLWEALATAPMLLADPATPLGELLDALDYRRHGEHLHAAGDAFDDGPPNVGGLRDEILAYAYHLADADLEAADRLFALRDRLAAGDDLTAEDLATAAQALAVGGVADAFAGECEGSEQATALAEAVLATGATGSAAAGARLVLAAASEWRGDAAAAERHLLAAVDADPGFAPAAAGAAWYAEDRGDVTRALELLRAAGAGDAELERLRHLAAPGPARVGRNQPCPCGSGRKFKKCCADRPGGTLDQRAPWVAHKVLAWLDRPPQRQRTHAIAAARAASDSTFDVCLAHDDPVVVDLALFDLGLLDAFLAQRGALLPPDERALVESWRASRRALYRIAGTRPGAVTLEPVCSGEAVTVRVRPPVVLPPGEFVLCRVLSDGQAPTLLLPGARLGSARNPELEELLAADPQPVELAAFFAPGPPKVCNVEGEAAVLCRTRYALSDPDAALATLRAGDLDEVETGRFWEWTERDGRRWGRGRVTVAGTELVVETNGEARMEELCARLEASIDGLALLSDERTPVWQALHDYWRFAPHDDPPADLRGVLNEHVDDGQPSWRERGQPVRTARTSMTR